MKRYALLITCAFMLASSGCCLFGRPCGYGGYGAGYAPSFGGYPAQGGCPSGACGQYPGAYMGGAPTAVAPYGYPQTAIVDPLPVY